jgi:hypothetical protein
LGPEAYACAARDRRARFPATDPSPVLDSGAEYLLRLFEVIARVQQSVEFGAVLGPLFDFVEITIVRHERIVSRLVGPIVIRARRA